VIRAKRKSAVEIQAEKREAFRIKRAAVRLKHLTQIILKFKGSTDGNTMLNLAEEIYYLQGTINDLVRAANLAAERKPLVLMGPRPYWSVKKCD
jgi:hypothetical protein